MIGELISQETCGLKQVEVERSTLDSLRARKLKLELSLKEVNEAIQFLIDNPTFTQGLELVGKALRR